MYIIEDSHGKLLATSREKPQTRPYDIVDVVDNKSYPLNSVVSLGCSSIEAFDLLLDDEHYRMYDARDVEDAYAIAHPGSPRPIRNWLYRYDVATAQGYPISMAPGAKFSNGIAYLRLVGVILTDARVVEILGYMWPPQG